MEIREFSKVVDKDWRIEKTGESGLSVGAARSPRKEIPICRKDMGSQDYGDMAGTSFPVTTDRPLGARRPYRPDMVYPMDCGCADGITAGDGGQ